MPGGLAFQKKLNKKGGREVLGAFIGAPSKIP